MATECPVWARCGGCPLMESPIEVQAEYKLRRVEEVFRQADLERPHSLNWVSSPRTIGYRNRVRVAVRHGVVSFFNPEKNMSCIVLEPALVGLLQKMRSLSQADPTLLLGVSHMELRSEDLNGQMGVHLTTEDGIGFDESMLKKALGAQVLVGMSNRTSPLQRFPVGTSAYGLTPLSSFMQVNHGVNQRLLTHVIDGALKRGVRRFMDLFCGAGNFSLGLASAAVSYTHLTLPTTPYV